MSLGLLRREIKRHQSKPMFEFKIGSVFSNVAPISLFVSVEEKPWSVILPQIVVFHLIEYWLIIGKIFYSKWQFFI